MSLSEVYRAYGEDSEAGARARQILDQQHWYASIAEFDPRTGDALPLGFDEVLHRIAVRSESTILRDRLWRIVDHSRLSIEHIFGSLSENPRREQAYLPVRDVKELNAASFIALSRRPGRNVREKLAGKPYMQAVRRYQSVDLPQNRLVKEFVTRLADLLELRKKHLGHEDTLLGDIYRWLRTDDAQAIGRWENLPPNNTLLSHRDYRRVWDAWRWLQVLDGTIARDVTQLEARAATVEKWEGFGKSYSTGTTLFGDMPVLLDYDTFAIEPWREPVLRGAELTSRPDRSRPAVDSPVCIDLTYLRPRFATIGSQSSSTLPEAYLWQRWRRDNDSMDLELFNADFALLHPDATSISTSDLFFSNGADESNLELAANAFTRKLSRTFTDSALTWLAPDFLNDFQLQVVRRNINARFSKAEPLPRSVAAVFEQIDYTKIRSDGFQVVVVDRTAGTTYATKLIARYDKDLQERVPETRGFYWERSPHVNLHRDSTGHDALAEISHIDKDGRWNDRRSATGSQAVSQETLRRHPQLGEFDLYITIAASPVCGGIRLQELQARAGDISLWRDHIPELSIKVIKDSRYQPFFLVDRDTRIRPIRGSAVPIPVGDLFTLPAGRAYYQFPLFQGDDPDDLGYVAKLESPAFPLPNDTTCRLTMTYTYGADDPYRLIFKPLDGAFKPVPVKWQPKNDEIITDAPAPEYPNPQTWAEVEAHFNPEKGETTNFPEWASRKTEELTETLSSLNSIVHGTLKTEWKTNSNGWHFAFAQRELGNDVYIHQNALTASTSYDSIAMGDNIYFVVTQRNGRETTNYVATSPTVVTTAAAKDVSDSIRRALYVPYIRSWSDGRSLSDPECPAYFSSRMTVLLPELEAALYSDATPHQVKSELRFLLCCTHKDMPESVSSDLLSQLTAGPVDEKSLGFALGGLSRTWQKEIFDSLLERTDAQTLRIFARAIWRNEEFVHAFGADALSDLAHGTLAALNDLTRKSQLNRSHVSSLTRYCEFLLGMLRSRESQDAEIRMQLQPHQQITKDLADQIDRLTELILTSPFPLESRVQVANLPEKPEGDETPDLLYALRLYLTGDVGANAIRVTGVNDGEDD